MTKQFFCLALLGTAVALNASLPTTSAKAPKAANFAELTGPQRQGVWDLDKRVEEYLVAFDDDVATSLAEVEARLNERVYVEVPGPLDGEFISLTQKIQGRIAANKARVAQLVDAGIKPAAGIARQAVRLETVKELLDKHLLAHGVVVVEKEPKKDEPVTSRGGPRSSGSGKGGFFSGIKKHHVLGTLVLVGLGYAVWRKFLTTSEEDEK